MAARWHATHSKEIEFYEKYSVDLSYHQLQPKDDSNLPSCKSYPRVVCLGFST